MIRPATATDQRRPASGTGPSPGRHHRAPGASGAPAVGSAVSGPGQARHRRARRRAWANAAAAFRAAINGPGRNTNCQSINHNCQAISAAGRRSGRHNSNHCTGQAALAQAIGQQSGRARFNNAQYSRQHQSAGQSLQSFQFSLSIIMPICWRNSIDTINRQRQPAPAPQQQYTQRQSQYHAVQSQIQAHITCAQA